MSNNFMNMARENRALIKSLLVVYIIIWQFGILHSLIISKSFEYTLLNNNETTALLVAADAAVNSPALLHKISESEKVNDLLGFKFIYCFNSQGDLNLKLNRNIISYLPATYSIDIKNSEIFKKTNPRSPPYLLS